MGSVNKVYRRLISQNFNLQNQGSRKISPEKIPTHQTPPWKIPTQKIPTWNIPTHFINCFSSLFFHLILVHLHPPRMKNFYMSRTAQYSYLRKNSNNQRKWTMSSDRFPSWILSFVNIESCQTESQQVMSCEPTSQQLRVSHFEPMDQQVIKLTVCEAAN